jgi:hypothetical protein
VRGRVRGGEDVERASCTDSEVARELGAAADTEAAFCAARAWSLEEVRVGGFLSLIHKGEDDEDATSEISQLLPRRQGVCRWAPDEGSSCCEGLRRSSGMGRR